MILQCRCVLGLETPFSIVEQIIFHLYHITTFHMVTLCLMNKSDMTAGLKASCWVMYVSALKWHTLA